MENYRVIWQETIEQLKDVMPKSIHTFLNNISFSSVDGNTLNLSVPSAFTLANLSKYKEMISNTFSDKAGNNFSLDIKVNNSNEKKPFTAIKPNTEKNIPKSPKSSTNTTLNKKYTFDSFVYGENSELAFKAAKIIALNPGTSFNPCLIYGDVGLGKTHLLQAIGNFIDKNNPTMKIIYVTAETFTNEFISCFGAGESNTVKNKFKQKYRKTDVLLIDDIHFLQKKESTQEELFHTFNDLYESNKQIVFTCDRPIKELTDITERLKSRFTKGLNVDLKPPKYEVRMAIAKQKCKDMNITISDDVLDYICQSVKTNVRDLEGAITTASNSAKIIGKPLTIELAKEFIKDLIIEPTFKINEYTIDDVFKATSSYFNVSLMDLKGNSRSKNIKTPRNIATFISYKYGKFTQSDIGKYLNKDHTSIGYSINIIESIVEIDESIQKAIKEIRAKLEEK